MPAPASWTDWDAESLSGGALERDKVQIETALLVEDGCQECAQRLQSLLSSKRGIEKVHVKGDPPILCLHFDANMVSLGAVERMAREMGSELSHRYRHCRLALASSGSADSAASLAQALQSREGVLHASVNHAAGLVSVAFDSQAIDQAALEGIIAGMGFDLVPATAEIRLQPQPCSGGHSHSHGHKHGHSDRHSHSAQAGGHAGCGHGEKPDFLPRWLTDRWTIALVSAAGTFFLLGWLGESYLGFPPWAALACYVMAYIAGAYDISTHALPGLFKGRFDTDILMLAAAAGAAVLGQWSEGAFLLFLFALGHAGEHYALDRARSAVDALGQLMPKTARVRRGADVLEVAVEDLQVGERVVVRPGDRIPVDGKVSQGRSAVDQSPITGESAPVDKEVGDEVFAGTINQENALDVEVTKLAQDNTLQRVMQMVAEAQEQKSPTQAFTQRFTSRFVPLVLVFTLLMIVVPPWLGWLSWKASFYRAMLLLVASSPCALALGTPATVLAGIGQAARHGVLIKGGVHLENLGAVKVLALDKTGTLTEGRFEVTDLEPAGSVTPPELLSLAAAVEQQSSHPLAQAVVRQAQARKLALPPTEGLENLSGRGVRARLGEEIVLLGSLRLLQEQAPALTDEGLRARVEAFEAAGKTVMLVARGGSLVGVLALADQPRQEARTSLLALQRLGVSRLAMLTGDNEKAARRIADSVGISEVRAGLLPADKLEAIRELREIGKLAMIGDGVNDAPALALADVGVAMGGAGTAVALETADVALMSDDLSKLPFAVGLSRASRSIIKQNLAISMGVIALLMITSILGLASLGPTVLAHEGSTLVVVFNALRLMRYKPRAA
jgi:Cd2+/Zn2+-exporting ATPase